MKVIVDTCVWSYALRRQKLINSATVKQLTELVSESRIQMLGPIRQELLSGISSPSLFKQLRDHLSAFQDLSLQQNDFEKAAEFYNICRQKGIQGSNTDFLICAVSVNHKMSIFTDDKDFKRYAKCLPIIFL